jgi:hypothetical protein
MNHIKVYLIVLILLVLGLTGAKAQFSIKRSDLENNNIQEKIIYFEIKELSEKRIKKLKDQRTIENLKSQYQEENKILTQTLKDYWVTGEIKSLTTKELDKRIEEKQETWYISFYKHTDKFFEKRVHKRNVYYYYQHYTLSLYKNKKKVLIIPLVNSFISELDIQFAINMMQKIINDIDNISNLNEYAKVINQSSAIIRQKTLLIPQNYTIYSEEYIKNYYKGNIKIVKEQEIIDAINRNDLNYTYLLININHLSEKPTFNHFIFDCATNDPLFLYRQSSSFTKTGIQKSNMPVLKREIQFLLGSHFKKYNNKI